MGGESANRGDGTSFSRRSMLAAALVSAACRRRTDSKGGKVHLRFSAWGEPVELRAYARVIARYQKLHPDVVIELEQIGYRTRTEVDSSIAAGVGPDIFRVTYTDVGRYSPSGALIDLSSYLPPSFGDAFTEQTWTAVQYKERPHALPHHTDTSAILYNRPLFQKLGIRVPQSLSESWSWEEFIDVAHKLKGECEFAFAVNWVLGGSFRWLNFLHQRGGRLLKDDYRRAAIPSEAAFATVEWTQRFFREQLVPMSDSAKSGEQVENLFATGVVGMYFDVGPQALRELNPSFAWGATFLPHDVQSASELGGTAIGVTRNTQHPDIAADFALFMTNEQNMLEFITDAEFLPVRKNLLKRRIAWQYHRDELQVHLEQSKTVPVELARTVTLPVFHRIGRALGDELDLAFTGGQSAEDTVRNLTRKLERVADLL